MIDAKEMLAMTASSVSPWGIAHVNAMCFIEGVMRIAALNAKLSIFYPQEEVESWVGSDGKSLITAKLKDLGYKLINHIEAQDCPRGCDPHLEISWANN